MTETKRVTLKLSNNKTRMMFYLNRDTLFMIFSVVLMFLGFVFIILFVRLGKNKSLLSPVPLDTPLTTLATPSATLTPRRRWNSGTVTWYGARASECLKCKPYYRDDGSVYFITASGEILDDEKFTVAVNIYNSYLMGETIEFLLDPDGDGRGRLVEARVNDTGATYDFDMSKVTFESLAPLSTGKMQIRWRIK